MPGYDLDAEFDILEMVIKAREEAGLAQEELARRIGTKQPALSRLERGGFQKAKIETKGKVLYESRRSRHLSVLH